MEESIRRIESFIAGIGFLVILHSIIEWFYFYEYLSAITEACNIIGNVDCEYTGWMKYAISIVIETIIGLSLIGFNLQDLNSNTSQEGNTARQKSKETPRVLDEIWGDEENDGQKKRCKFWGDAGRCNNYHAYASYCDEHRNYLENQKIGGLK